MVANKNVERLPKSRVKLTLTVPQADVSKEYAALIAEYAKNVRIDGFRKGKVPPAVLERKFGEGLKLDAMARVMEKSVEEAVKDIPEKPLAYSQPSLEGEPEFKMDQDFTFTVSYDVFPEISPPDWKGIEIELPNVSVSAADEERELKAIRERNAIIMDKDAGAKAAKGDVVTLSYRELDEQDQTVPGSERQDFTFELGGGYNLYKFDDEIKGMKKDQEKVFSKTFPEDYEYQELAGKTVKLAVKATAIKSKKLPELDDELAQDVSEKFKTLDDLKADIKKQLEKRLEDKLKSLKEEAIVTGLLARASVEVPESMVEAELGMRLENLMRQTGMDSVDKLDRILSFSGKTRQSLAEEWRPSAEKAIATRLLIEKMAEDGKYECSDADLEAEFERMAGEASMSAAEVKAEYEKRGGIDYLKQRIREDKLMADIAAAAKQKKGKKLSYVDLFADNE